MKFLFDFGISQEDPLSEQEGLDIQPGDRLLSLASAGEVALSLLSINQNIRVVAVDISEAQTRLCRLKLISALHIAFPLNGQFLGYAKMQPQKRNELYHESVRPHLPGPDALFWDQNIIFIEDGIINAGRFEQYIRKLRFIVNMFIGRKNLDRLINCRNPEEQSRVFQKHIAERLSLRVLFKVAFHPVIYRKRGLDEKALIHAGKSTGERFYSRFRDFCTSSPAAGNYFLQYFLTGGCKTDEALPVYLKPENRPALKNNLQELTFETSSFQDALRIAGKGFFNKIHLSNLGDWLSEEQFAEILDLIKENCNAGTKICCRYLQKNHFKEGNPGGFRIDNELSERVEAKDRFPFYSILILTLQAENIT